MTTDKIILYPYFAALAIWCCYQLKKSGITFRELFYGIWHLIVMVVSLIVGIGSFILALYCLGSLMANFSIPVRIVQ